MVWERDGDMEGKQTTGTQGTRDRGEGGENRVKGRERRTIKKNISPLPGAPSSHNRAAANVYWDDRAWGGHLWVPFEMPGS